MRYLFVKYDDWWADEMKVSGGIVLTPQEWEDYKKVAKEAFEKFPYVYFCIGTNEDIRYEDYDELFGCFTITEINTAEKEFLEKLELNKFGIFPDRLFDNMDEWEEWYD